MPNYKTQGDYEAYLADKDEALLSVRKKLRSKPRVLKDDTGGFLVDLYALHPQGNAGPQLGQPWIWYAHLDAWYCQVTRDCVERLVSDAKKLFEIEEG